MKFKYIIIKGLVFFALVTHISSCDNPLVPQVYSELSTEVLTTKSGIDAALNSLYANALFQPFDGNIAYTMPPMLSSGVAYSIKGGANSYLQPITDFTWDVNNNALNNFWNICYRSIRDANIVIENIESSAFSSDYIKEISGEARFLRGWIYMQLYINFGPVVLHTSSEDEAIIPRASEEEIISQIKNDLTYAVENLPLNQNDYGRATKGAALGLLCKFYLNLKEWKNSSDIAEQIIELNKYGLISNYKDVFSLENEGNKELLWVLPRTYTRGQNINAFTFPKDYPLPGSQRVFAAETYLYDDFVNSFDDEDTRKDMIITEYTNNSGSQIIGLGNDKSLSLKYEWDPNSTGAGAGNDFPVIRYADILLSRAEALNELNGTTQEAIDLINQVKARAGISLLKIGDFDKDSFREQIFKEREKEFYYEFKGREDQLRHGTFISAAIARGKNAQAYHVLFPIPQNEMDANTEIEQNPGY